MPVGLLGAVESAGHSNVHAHNIIMHGPADFF